MSFKFVYGDSCDVINMVEAINDELKKEGFLIHFEFDNQEYDGFEIVHLIRDDRILIKIDRNSIKLNPNFGQTTYQVPGQTASLSRPVQLIRTINPEPKYLFSHETTIIECQYCHEKFPHIELQSESYTDCDGESICNTVCPKCKKHHCCKTLQFEQIEDIKEEL